MEMGGVRLDEIGYWSEIKLDIVRKYAQAYATVLANDHRIRGYIYIDAFAGAGMHISKRTGEFVPGSPLNALNVAPPFSEYHFIDLDGDKAEHLRQLAGDAPNTHFYNEDCNSVLLNKVFARARWSDYRRALCLLDPYALNLDWEVLRTAGQMRSVEVFLNFMVMDMNMNVLWRNPDNVLPSQLERMDAFWGDRSWRGALYQKPRGLLPGFDWEEKVSNEEVATAYQKRLKEVAGFAYVPDPMPMRNTRGAVVYYLFFASPNATGAKIVSDIFNKYRDRGAS
jgi:three-Cys-motif partner protein